jgi:hypothetical protein
MNVEYFKPEQETVHEAAELLGKTFIQRKDIFASQLEDGRYVAIKETLTQRHLELHLKGHITLGAYMLTPESTTNQMVFDADGENGLVDLADLSYELETEGIPTYLEISRRGGHLRFFFEQHHDGGQVRAFGNGIIRRHELAGIELYPKQDRLYTGPGSLVRLPFGIHKKSGQRYPFIHRDGAWLAPTVREQIMLLSDHKSVPEDVFGAYATYELEKRKKRVPKLSGTIYDSSDIERVKKAVPLMEFVEAFVDLRPVASGAVGKCPFHDDNHPSFGVNKEGNYWQCFAGCGSGSIIDFWMKWKGVEFSQAVSELAELLEVNGEKGGNDVRQK